MNSDDLCMPYLGIKGYRGVYVGNFVVDTENDNMEVGIKCASCKNKAKYLINI